MFEISGDTCIIVSVDMMLRNARKSRGNAVSISLQILCAVSEAASDDASTF